MQDANRLRESEQPLERGVCLEVVSEVAEALQSLPTNDLESEDSELKGEVDSCHAILFEMDGLDDETS